MKEISGGSDPGGKPHWSGVAPLNDASLVIQVKDWVIEQTLERARRDLEADELEYEERLAQARKREEAIRRAAKAKVTKKIVSVLYNVEGS
jgi:chromosome transmission fidelity protein 1